MSVLAPKIDKRTYEQIVAQVEALAETLTNAAVPPTVEMLTGRILAQDLQDALGAIPAGTVLDAELAQRISRIPGLERVQVKGWHHSDSEEIKKVDVSVETLTGRVLAEDIIETADGSGKPGIIPAGAILDAELIQRLRQIKDLDQVKVINDPPHRPRDAGGGLIRIFGRFMELVVDRLNRVPEKNYLAFLNLIGADLLPPQPARALLTFYLAANSPVDGVVPAGTQAAAPPAEGEAEEVIFETEQELVVSRAQLQAVLVREPAKDRYGDYTEQARGDKDEAFPAFSGDQPVEHSLYLACDDLFTLPGPKTIILTFDSPHGSQLERLTVNWSFWDGASWQKTTPSSSSQDNQWVVTIDNMPVPAPKTINGRKAAWLRASLDTPLPLADEDELPEVRHISVKVKLSHSDLIPDLAFTNSLPLDLSKDFYPFGEQPRFNDTFYLSLDEAITKGGAKTGLTFGIQINLTEPGVAGGEKSGQGTNPNGANGQNSDEVMISWEFWNGKIWEKLGKSTQGSEPTDSTAYSFQDSTKAFTTKTGEITFVLPEQIAPTTVNGQESYWLRARLVAGHYGLGPRWSEEDKKFIPANFKPPIVNSLKFSVSGTSRDTSLSACLSYNDFIYVDHIDDNVQSNPFVPFTPSADNQAALYLGFDTQFANRPVSLYVQVEPPQADEISPARLAAMTITTRPQVTWEYANADGGWTPVGAVDETQGFAGRGLIRFIGPRNFTRRQLFGQALYWVRARSEGGEFAVPPRLRRLLLNTTWASQATTVQNETLGSSTGNPGQAFQLAQSPVLPGLCLEVREAEMPTPAEQAQIKQQEGPDAITPTLDVAGHPEEIWVRWHAVPDFHGSGPRDRHYTIDYLTSAVRFGDGRYGLIPPLGQNNIRVARYRSGGGAGGNRPRETVIQLKSSVPYIDRVANFEEASGGGDRQSLDRVKRYGPRQLRHRGRAVTVEDFEDLAYAASADVARAKTIPISRDDGTKGGVIGLIVVPRSDVPQPIPSLGLLEQVKAYLQARCPATAEVWVAGPDWVEVTVTTEVVPASLAVADQVEMRLKAALDHFLHPLTGGPLNKGWPFGRLPHPSDLYALVESVEGVDHVRTLTVEPPSPGKTGPFLIYSGQHQITLGMA